MDRFASIYYTNCARKAGGVCGFLIVLAEVREPTDVFATKLIIAQPGVGVESQKVLV